PSRTWSFGAGVLQPIFNAGRIRSQVAQAEALQRQALHTYEKSVISAFQGVENALIDRTKFGQVREEQAKNVEALRSFRDLAALRYREGATIYLEVANAEQSLFNAQLAYVSTQSQLFQSYANLYKAMGGGWVGTTGDLAGNSVEGNAELVQALNDREPRERFERPPPPGEFTPVPPLPRGVADRDLHSVAGVDARRRRRRWRVGAAGLFDPGACRAW